MTHHRYLAINALKRTQLNPFAIVLAAPPHDGEHPEYAVDVLKTWAEWDALEDVSR